MKPTLLAHIERAQDVNANMFDAIDTASHAENIDAAYRCLLSRFGTEHSLYWFYLGGNHIAVQSRNHKQRIAIITDKRRNA